MWFTEGILFMSDIDEDLPLLFNESMSWVIVGTRGLSKHLSWLTMLLSGWLLRGLDALREQCFFPRKALEWYTLNHKKPEKCYSVALCEGQSPQPKIVRLHSFPLSSLDATPLFFTNTAKVRKRALSCQRPSCSLELQHSLLSDLIPFNKASE